MKVALEQIVPMTPERAAAAEDLVLSNIARAWGSREIDMTRVEKLFDVRTPGQPRAPEAIAPVLAVLVRAVCMALREVPMLNSRWTDDGIVLFRNIDIGIELPDGRGGRVVPAVRDADQLSLDELGTAVIAATRRGESESSTFTVGYSGAHGSILSRPLLHSGQAGIYHLGRARQVPWIVDDGIAVRTVAYASLTFDHRILDGSTSSKFQNLVKTTLESWTPDTRTS